MSKNKDPKPDQENDQKNNQNTPSNEEQNDRSIQDMSFSERILAHLDHFNDKFLSKFLTPSVLTVIITAIAGPFVVNLINEDLKNKELQKEVIEKMLDYTSQTDFSKPESLEKITLIAKMVDENREIFGLSFAQTDSTIQNLYGQISKVGLANLNQKRKEYEKSINELTEKLEKDTLVIKSLEEEKERILEDIEDVRRDSKKQTLQKRLSEIDIELNKLFTNKEVYLKQISFWKEQITQLDKDIKGAQENLAEVLEAKRNKELELKKILNAARHDKDTLSQSLKHAYDEIEQLREQLQHQQDLNEDSIGKLNTIIDKLKKELEEKDL